MEHRRWLRRGFALLAATSLLAAACGDDDDDTSAAPTTAPGASTSTSEAGTDAPRHGGMLRMNYWLETTRGFDPVQFQSLTISGGDGLRALALYDLLVMVDPKTLEVEPRIAESFESTDATTWTIKIRPNVKFTDGTPYNAEAVKFNWERHADPNLRSAAQAVAQDIASMTVVDDLTLRVTLKAPNGQFPRIVAQRLSAIASPTALRADPEGFSTKPIGAGPFVLKEWTRDSRTIFTRNPDYWDAPRPYVDQFEMRIIPDHNQAFASMSAGEAHMMYTSDPTVADQASKAGYEASRFTASGGRNILLNATKPPFNDPRARRALTLAVNPNQMAEVVERGLTEPPKTIFTDDSPYFDPALTLPSHNAAEAQKLLDEYAQATGGPLEFDLMYAAPTKAHAEFLQAQLSQFRNLRMTITDVPTNYTGELLKKQYTAAFFTIVMTDPEPEAYDFFRSDSARNLAGFADARLDQAINAGHITLDEQRRKEAYRTMQRVLIDESVTVWFARFNQYVLVDDDKVGGYATVNDHVPRVDLMWLKG